jgi:hypothetical protein
VIELGTHAKCKYTGFTGVVNSRSSYLSGPDRYGLRKIDKDGKLVDEWFNEDDLEVIVPEK